MGAGHAKNLYSTSNNPLSPRTHDSLKRFMSSENIAAAMSPKKNQQSSKKNSKIINKLGGDTRGYQSSRNLSMVRRGKNATQLVAMPTSSRNTSSNVMLNNLSGIRNRRVGQRNRRSVEHLNSFKSNNIHKSSQERISKMKQTNSRSNANFSNTRKRNIKSDSRKPNEKKIDLTTQNMFKRNININPKFKQYIESKLKNGSKLHSDFLKRASIIASGKPDKIVNETQFSTSFVNSVSYSCFIFR